MAYQLMFSVDFDRCINCKTCEMACNDYYGLADAHRRNVVTYESEAQTPVHLSISCNHCMNPICVQVCPENNFEKRADGIVVHRASHCRACMRCITACPFSAPKLNPKINRADKCNFCVERIDQGMKPICVENCVTKALSLLEVNIDEVKANTFNRAEIPIMSYTNPSIFVKNKKAGLTFFREG